MFYVSYTLYCDILPGLVSLPSVLLESYGLLGGVTLAMPPPPRSYAPDLVFKFFLRWGQAVGGIGSVVQA